ncbi:30S ribosomal protein S8 [candidate division Kazan bacterium]|uniref:Small ribosomal subunit protein uS8 n=1 Tax=candidate division Kazan bacterium TaxID=2202143 RepID=A0A420ZDT1_UNCK3|nr:MAG: 30S ribosomal protein S8 [candidate division Kazan bacterium]
MITTDSIADLLTRIRNAIAVRKRFALIFHSKLNLAIVNVLKNQGYIGEFSVVPDKTKKFKQIKVMLKYDANGDPVIRGLSRISKPGQRIYTPVHRLRKVLGGVGVAVVSTSKGLLTDAEARRENLGGEILFKIW